MLKHDLVIQRVNFTRYIGGIIWNSVTKYTTETIYFFKYIHM